MANTKSVIIKIKRQLTPDAKPSWEEFEIPYKPNMNVTSALMEIAANPVTRDGKQTTPITYDSNCLEEICGSCAMLINGRARMACSALLDHLDQPIKLEPFSKFPVVRDLAVDRSVLFENLKKVKAWVPVDGSYDLGPGPRVTMEDAGKGLSAVELHLVLLLHGSLPAVQRRHGIRRRGRHLASAPVQHASHRAGSEARAVVGTDGRRRNPGMRLRAKLRRDLSQGNSADHVDCRSRRPSHEAGARRSAAEMTALCGRRIPVETGLPRLRSHDSGHAASERRQAASLPKLRVPEINKLPLGNHP